jgi:methylmalonyl-CoA mutase N-terminal domain/subunit
MGGALAAIEGGYMQHEIQEAAYRYQKAIEAEEQVVVGLNKFQTNETIELDRLSVDPVIEKNQKDRLAQLRANRNQDRVNDLLAQLTAAASGTDNLMPIMIECVENHTTLGEVCGSLRKVWGEYQSSSWI